MTLHFQHLIFPIGQLMFITRISGLNFSNIFLPFECLPERQHSFCFSWHCNLSATGRRLAIDKVLEIKDPNYSRLIGDRSATVR